MSGAADVLAFWPEAVALFPRIFTKQLVARDDPELPYHTWAGLEPLPDNPLIKVRTGYVVAKKTAAHEFGHLFHWLIRLLDPAFEEDFWRWRFGAWPSAPKTWATAQADSGNVWAMLPGEILAETFAAAVLGYIESDKGMDWGYELTDAGGALGARDFFTKAMNKVRPPAVVVPPPAPGGTPTMLQIINLPSPNFGKGGILGVHGRSQPIRYVVLHTTEGTDSRSWLTNRASNVSATYLVREEGIYRLVDEADVAWHAGRIVGIPTTPLYSGINPNEESIGIEIEGFAGQTISARKFAFTVALVNDIRSRRGDLPRVGHFELSPGDRSDPGLPNFTAIQNRLGGWLDMDEQTLRRIIREEATIPLADKLNAGFNVTAVALLRRTARWIRLGIARDPAGDTSVSPPRAYPDDATPLS